MSDPFSTLGLPASFDLRPDEIDRAYRDLQKVLHPDRFAGRSPQERRLGFGRAVEVNQAYRIVRNDLARAEALLTLRGHAVSPDRKALPALLMEMMERREALSEARAAGDLETVRAVAEEVRSERAAACTQLSELFALEPEAGSSSVADAVIRLRYLERFLDELEAIEEDAASVP